ncbi:MAG: phenylalanine--tRNA ligase subunit beta [Deltaproteobacteria bacterium]|nr:phenylalanine--tRNA ligase subunit beta [Deltaproteobacteria bacterium]MBW1948771.1 phenylalanine--tRNA ligase subunit beta [Deltaproteobacteria bacterium]MBW2006449.1 phenylalanine--tRNA ligase subunit beta [Deltaproteobacteria bacterium]MBW2346328.1 phenylalanine--tRNA ligase subunit beta [Deltaproteobacteria bacterium]RLB38465.1 MAG: phenylalanine--tRNA ligase subunit beta [Deltaproteobacteria bacterium]
MKVCLSWLKEYVDIDMSPEALSEALTMVGLEVEGLEPVGSGLERVVAARIESLEKHPNADRLALCRVNTGAGTHTVVCGAPNLREGMRVPLACPGADLPGVGAVSETEIRGVASWGMLLAEDEMGLTDDHSGILELPEGATPGLGVAEVLGLPDWTLEIGLTPNRPDCACVLGIAREIAALTGRRLKQPPIDYREQGPEIHRRAGVEIRDPVGCPRYAAGLVQGVRLSPSPFWMRYRLHQSGVRSINNVVDVTNYVLLEMGQPLHAFDYDRLRRNRIVVQRAEDGSRFTTLDGRTRDLDGETLMICDAERPVALAGIMGGLNSEIFAGSENVLVESAYFDPVTIRRASKRLGLSTEASYRFERGVDIEGVTRALRRSLHLISSLAGGAVARGLIDEYPEPFSRPTVVLRVERANQLLGTELGEEKIRKYLEALEMDVESGGRGQLQVRPPAFRVDITREVDLVEEVARMEGYQKIPVTFPRLRGGAGPLSRDLVLRDRVRAAMVGFGFSEIITYSFVSPEALDILHGPGQDPSTEAVKLLNPLSSEQSVMRTSLLPGLLAAMKNNALRGEKEIKIFEWGKVFRVTAEGPLPEERPFLGVLMMGVFQRKAWYNTLRAVDFYDMKGVAEAILQEIGVGEAVFRKAQDPPGYRPEVSAEIVVGESQIGLLGQVAPRVMEAYELEKESAFAFELDVEALLGLDLAGKVYRPVAKYPAVYRDISIVVADSVESAAVWRVIREAGGDLVESVELFDSFSGRGMEPGQKALGFRVCYRSQSHTLDGVEVNRLHEHVIDRIREQTGGRLREG